ncbi:MAG: molybdenum cofactor guanylyltransferase [Chloroflexota bacterium]|nr:molybdenum cofactor guanylyltransferase [Chloroflexota bacterium]
MSEAAASTACVILAGGRSRRMGRNKALLPLPGIERVTFIEHLASMLTSLCPEVLIVARDSADAAHYTLPGVRTVTDEVPDHGPLMGLASALRAMHATRALLLAVDMPHVQPALVTFFLSQPATAALLVPIVDNIPQVLLALYPRSCLPFIEQRIHQGRRDPRSLLDIAPVCYIAEAQLRQVDPQLRSFVNVNTPEDFNLLT